MFSFGTPEKEADNPNQYLSAGKSVRFGQSPSDMGISPIEEEAETKPKKKKRTKGKYVPKSANERLIDVKNATWDTKAKLAMHGKNMQGKVLYALGPQEAYIVDKIFDKEQNLNEIGTLSHEGEKTLQKKPQREYTVTMDTGYNNELQGSKSNVTPSMRNQLYEDMHKEHEIVVSSPKKYPRNAE